MRYLFRFGYFGDIYFGVTRQPGLPTIESAIRDAFGDYLGNGPVIFSSRTDRGVHAISNVFSVNLKSFPPIGEINSKLEDIWVWGWAKTDINPQKNTLWRTYRYVFPKRFDKKSVERMGKAAKCFLGKHDFVSFSIPEVENTVREVLDVKVYNRGLTVFEIKARGFLRQMVRRMAFALYKIGLNEWDKDEIKKRLERRAPVPPMPPEGLILLHVEIPGIRFKVSKEWFEKMVEEWEKRRIAKKVESVSLSFVSDFNPFADIL